MSIWSSISGHIKLDSTIPQGAFLMNYGLYAKSFSGSEGGLDIQFTSSTKKDWSSSSENYYNVTNFSEVDGIVMSGRLRDFDEGCCDHAADEMESFLIRLKKQFTYCIESASFIISCDTSDSYWVVTLSNEHVNKTLVNFKDCHKVTPEKPLNTLVCVNVFPQYANEIAKYYFLTSLEKTDVREHFVLAVLEFLDTSTLDVERMNVIDIFDNMPDNHFKKHLLIPVSDFSECDFKGMPVEITFDVNETFGK